MRWPWRKRQWEEDVRRRAEERQGQEQRVRWVEQQLEAIRAEVRIRARRRH